MCIGYVDSHTIDLHSPLSFTAGRPLLSTVRDMTTVSYFLFVR